MSGLEQGWGLQVVLWFQSWRSALVGDVGLFFAFLGSENAVMPILALVYWCVDVAFGRELAVLFLLQSWGNTLLKEVFQRPRPYQVSKDVHPVSAPGVPVENSPGMPSGHTQTATVMSGAVALKARRRWVTVAMALLALLTGISRMVVGAHYPQDVIGGLLIGLIVLGLYAWLARPVIAWIGRQTLWAQIGLAAAAGVAMLVIHPLLIPALYPDDLDYALSAGGAMLGAGVGFALEARYVRFDVAGTWQKQVVRFVLGLALLLGVRFGLSALFAALQPVWLLRVIRYTCIGLSVGWLAPWLFVKLGLAGRRA